ncbi:hypothetical protein L1987_79042 [Smallanthus sonchifolius]|uniref:Uncharacterized protein n=1 Tax=Smallanthus sonchifolius TaxID=185202 RepID=A0ACB8ZFE3_9ASTR|nr:hypothetical protein L1987_79042 [Smallanthus sonchifolius]
MLLLLLNHPSFDSLLKKTIWNKVEKGLVPVLDNIARQGVEMDLQETFQRFGFDLTCAIIIDHDLESLCVEYPHVPCVKAFSHAEEGIFGRHIMPEKVWKLQRLLRMGNEKKLSNAWRIIDEFIYKVLAEKRKAFGNKNYEAEAEAELEAEAKGEDFNFLRALMRELKDQSGTSGDPNKFLRDISFNLMLAGRDSTGSTLSWLFYLITKNPIAEEKIREELDTQLADKDMRAIDLSNLVYLHGVICETLRLFPAVPFQHKIPAQPDTLPSGYQVDCNTTIILFFYTTGRMESVRGKDCMEFKPERWFATRGGIKHEPYYKFPAFNAGPRSCLGKHMSFTQIKIVVATIIYRYHVEMVEGHPVLPSDSIILQMKYGMKVKLAKRSEV